MAESSVIYARISLFILKQKHQRDSRGVFWYTEHMIFKMISMYFKAKKGIKDPEGFVVEEAQDIVTGAMIIPLLIFVPIIVILGMLSFSHLITAPSIAAQIFFWIFVVVFIGYLAIVIMLRVLIGRIIRKLEQTIQNPR